MGRELSLSPYKNMIPISENAETLSAQTAFTSEYLPFKPPSIETDIYYSRNYENVLLLKQKMLLITTFVTVLVQ
jgi:hypothetical protein